MIASDPAQAALATPDRAAVVAAEAGTATGEPAVEAVSETVAGSAPSAPDTAAGVAAKVEETGDPRVDAALRRLPDVDALSTDEHALVYEDVHRRLRDALAGVDDSGNGETSSEEGAPPDLAAGKG
jgi:hypothetical protein